MKRPYVDPRMLNPIVRDEWTSRDVRVDGERAPDAERVDAPNAAAETRKQPVSVPAPSTATPTS